MEGRSKLTARPISKEIKRNVIKRGRVRRLNYEKGGIPLSDLLKIEDYIGNYKGYYEYIKGRLNDIKDTSWNFKTLSPFWPI